MAEPERVSSGGRRVLPPEPNWCLRAYLSVSQIHRRKVVLFRGALV